MLNRKTGNQTLMSESLIIERGSVAICLWVGVKRVTSGPTRGSAKTGRGWRISGCPRWKLTKDTCSTFSESCVYCGSCVTQQYVDTAVIRASPVSQVMSIKQINAVTFVLFQAVVMMCSVITSATLNKCTVVHVCVMRTLVFYVEINKCSYLPI